MPRAGARGLLSGLGGAAAAAAAAAAARCACVRALLAAGLAFAASFTKALARRLQEAAVASAVSVQSRRDLRRAAAAATLPAALLLSWASGSDTMELTECLGAGSARSSWPAPARAGAAARALGATAPPPAEKVGLASLA